MFDVGHVVRATAGVYMFSQKNEEQLKPNCRLMPIERALRSILVACCIVLGAFCVQPQAIAEKGTPEFDLKIEDIVDPHANEWNEMSIEVARGLDQDLVVSIKNFVDAIMRGSKKTKYLIACEQKREHAIALDEPSLERMYDKQGTMLSNKSDLAQSFKNVHRWLARNCNGYEISMAWMNEKYSLVRIKMNRNPTP